jgi:hypothetical protein
MGTIREISGGTALFMRLRMSYDSGRDNILLLSLPLSRKLDEGIKFD